MTGRAPLTDASASGARDGPGHRLHVRSMLLWPGFRLTHLSVGPRALTDQLALLGLATVVLGTPILVVVALVTWRILRRSPAHAAGPETTRRTAFPTPFAASRIATRIPVVPT